MCGRLTTPEDWSDLKVRLRLDVELDDTHDLEASGNVAPTEEAPIVWEREDGRRAAAPANFGFEGGPRPGGHVINARVETVGEKRMFSKALRERRCLIIADGFYEWTGPKSARIPHHIVVPERTPFTVAGLYRIDARPGGATSLSFVALTAAAGETMRELHDREPVIVDEAARDAWLAGDDATRALEHVLETRRRDLVHWEVSRAVSRAGNHDRALRLPVRPEVPRQGSLF